MQFLKFTISPCASVSIMLYLIPEEKVHFSGVEFSVSAKSPVILNHPGLFSALVGQDAILPLLLSREPFA